MHVLLQCSKSINMTPFTKHVWLLAQLCLLLHISVSEAGFLTHKARVRVTNNIGVAKDLVLRCQSKDDDLGVHIIPFKGDYEFGFRPNFWGRTQFYCTMSWPSQFHYFDIYIASRDQFLCNTCLWNITEQRPCMFNYKTSRYDICYEWPAMPPQWSVVFLTMKWKILSFWICFNKNSTIFFFWFFFYLLPRLGEFEWQLNICFSFS